ncbi:DUF6925 family protein [Methylobrevis albus]|uniref:NERD domain-containing protein n=1 Tax=Methylobrevis albus TaxID=2793297 RepID=A0A931N1J1_9HYPH|nr:hypothetical protein [Methylobrevis albus]MBH0239876.1 hypothetical protein [Methylobrevis albus]
MMPDPTPPVTGTPDREILDLVRDLLADAGTSWAVGTFGAIGEFLRDANEPARLDAAGGAVSVVTARGGLRLGPIPGLRPVAYETSFGAGWSHALAFCLPAAEAAMAGRSVLTELGPDVDALREADRDGILFDLGLGCLQVDVLVRVAPDAAAKLRPHLGRALFEPGNAAMHAIFDLQPPRVFVTRIGRAEIFQPIPPPGGTSPEGPHTHILPQLLKGGRTHAATMPIPAGLVPCAYAFPPHPLKTADGRPRPFDEGADAAFRALLARYGDPDLLALKRRIERRVAAGEPVTLVAGTRFGRMAERVALEQLRRLHPIDAALLAGLGEPGGDGDTDRPDHA